MGSPEAGGGGVVAERSYAIPFHDVWEAALASVGALRGWAVVDRDPRAGELRLRTLNRLGRAPLQGRVRLWLDEMGQTRLEVRFDETRRLLGGGSARTRATRFLRRLERLLDNRGGR